MRIDPAPLAVVAVFACLATALAQASPQPQTKITGLITLRSGEVMNIQTAEGKNIEVVLNPDTKIEQPEGAFGFRKKELNVTGLVPGLKVTVQGLQYENNQLVAKAVTFSKESLQSASAVRSAAGAQTSAANPANLSDYELKATYEAHFATGSALLSDADKAGLLNLASNAAALPAYMIQVLGYSDFAGGNSYDQQMARDRAEAVIDFLRTSGRIPVTRIVAPGAMGSSTLGGGDGPPQGAPQTGRADVKLLVKSAGK
jgi:outer membrane protein OmpA-like peptidoglycan-associated protein